MDQVAQSDKGGVIVQVNGAGEWWYINPSIRFSTILNFYTEEKPVNAIMIVVPRKLPRRLLKLLKAPST